MSTPPLPEAVSWQRERSQPVSSSAHILNLPTELLIEIVKYLQPLTVEEVFRGFIEFTCPCTRDTWFERGKSTNIPAYCRCACRTPPDLKRLSMTCRSWKTVVQSQVTAECLEEPSSMAVIWTTSWFLDRCLNCPFRERVKHLHLSFHPLSTVRDLGDMLSSFPSLAFIELNNVYAVEWPTVAGVLANSSSLSMLTLHASCTFRRNFQGTDYPNWPPATDANQLRQVKKLHITCFGEGMQFSLTCFPQIQHLGLRLRGNYGFSRPDGLENGLRITQATLISLYLRGIDEDDFFDLRCLEKLEQFEDACPGARGYYKLAKSVKQIAYTGVVDDHVDCQDPEVQDGMHDWKQLTKTWMDVAPGLEPVIMTMVANKSSRHRAPTIADLQKPFSRAGLNCRVRLLGMED